jgi:Flp pilus assembly protein TadD
MPYTLNGIGTHYYGSRNRSPRVGTCESCHRSATLWSYDTREWFCVIFVPLIPLRRFRIIDECSSCRTHHRLPLHEFNQHLEDTLTPLRASASRDPRNVAARLELVRSLSGFGLGKEAATEVEAALAACGDHAGLCLVAGQLAADVADWDRALAHLTKAWALDSSDPDIAMTYGWLLNRVDRHEEALTPLRSAATNTGTRTQAIYLLGRSQMNLARPHEALQSFQQLLAIEPALETDKSLLALVADCKKQVGYDLTPAEARAGRRWWPFGQRERKPPTLAAPPTLVRPSLRYAGIALAALALVAFGVTWWDAKTNIVIYVDNGLDHGVDIDLDGRSWTMHANSHRKETLKEGRHTIIVRERESGREIEQFPFEVSELGPFEAIGAERFFVYNVAARRVYRREVIGYASSLENQSYDLQWIALQPFFEQRGVDYPFATAPETISSSSGATVKKVSFNPATDIHLEDYSLIRLQEGDLAGARAAIDAAVTATPCETGTRRLHLLVASLTDPDDGGVGAARQWISDCAPDDLEAHRAYQDLHTSRDSGAAMRAEYAARVAEDPASAKLHYLYGRVSSEPAIAVREYNEALRLDPSLAWPRVALGYEQAMDGRFAVALREFGAALDIEGHDPGVIIYYAGAAIANGTPEGALELVERRLAENRKDPAALEASWMLANATMNWDGATAFQKTLLPIEGEAAAWWRNTRSLRFRGDDAALELELERAAHNEELAAIAQRVRIERAIERGDLALAEEQIALSGELLDPAHLALLEAYVSGAWQLAGDSPAAARSLQAALALLEGTGEDAWLIRAVIEGLNGTRPLEELFSVTRQNNMISHAWFVAAVKERNPATAAAKLRRASLAAMDLDFPHLETSAMADRIGR